MSIIDIPDCLNYSISVEIVFVHLGSRIPKHLTLNIQRTFALFPEKSIVLITDQNYHSQDIAIKVERIIVQDEFDAVSKNLNHPLEFRNGFWISTLLRLTAIARYAEKSSQPILHVESDVILSEDFPFDSFMGMGDVACFPLVSPGQAVASVLYVGGNNTGKKLSDYIQYEVKRNATTSDMRVLDSFRKFSSESVEILPTGPMNPSAYLQSYNFKLQEMAQKNLGVFGGLFDAIDIGFYFFGEDPRNNRGFRLIHKVDETSYLKLRLVRFSFDKKRNFFNMEYDGEIYPLFTLHIHSKDLRAFELKKFGKLAEKRIRNSSLGVSREFILSSFLKLLVPYLRKKLKSV